MVGDVLGKYHPHGDTAVYDSLVRMVQDFSLHYPLVDGQGNFGSIDGDGARRIGTPRPGWPRSRWRCWPTSRRRPSISLRTSTIAWVEPTVLPSRFPNLLVNGSSGIAVGMATNIPPHNLREIVAAVTPDRGPGPTIEDLLRFVPGAGLPHGRHRLRKDGHPGCVTHRSGPHGDASAGGGGTAAAAGALIVTEIPVQGQQDPRSRADRRAGRGTADRGYR